MLLARRSLISERLRKKATIQARKYYPTIPAENFPAMVAAVGECVGPDL